MLVPQRQKNRVFSNMYRKQIKIAQKILRQSELVSSLQSLQSYLPSHTSDLDTHWSLLLQANSSREHWIPDGGGVPVTSKRNFLQEKQKIAFLLLINNCAICTECTIILVLERNYSNRSLKITCMADDILCPWTYNSCILSYIQHLS